MVPRSLNPLRGERRAATDAARLVAQGYSEVSTPFAGNVALRPSEEKNLFMDVRRLNPLRGERRAATDNPATVVYREYLSQPPSRGTSRCDPVGLT